MYLEHFGLREPPFKIVPNAEFFYAGGNRGPVLEALLYAIAQGGIVKVTGEVGSGKTMLCTMLQARLPQHVETVYIANPGVSPEEILRAIAFELGPKLQTFTRAANADAVEARLREVVGRLRERGITEAEREAAAGFLLGRRAFSRQSPEQVLTTWMNERTLGLPEGFLDARAARAARVPLEEVNAFARRFYDPARWGMVRVVPD